jgi:ornithine cyclodeaminase/alanine dehydrogenase-like protein (mu-crystallin family)
MAEAIETMKDAFGQLSGGRAMVPLRTPVDTEKGVSLVMPAYLHTSKNLVVKVVSVYGDNPSIGLPAVNATVLVLDPETGMPKAFMEGDSLTAIRTGAGGGLAAELLARRNAKTVALFGAGVQARAQLQAVMAVRKIEHVMILDRSGRSGKKLASEIAEWSEAPSVEISVIAREAVRKADIVIAATNASTPLFDGNDLRPGTHVTGVGSFRRDMQEIDEVTVRRARVVVDSREACLAEAGDLVIPGVSPDAEIGEIVNGSAPGRQNNEEITFFKSVGVAAQDAAAAAAVVKVAEEKGLGTVVDLS